jgi:hypothetical protein
MRPEDLSVNHLADSFGNAARALIRISFQEGSILPNPGNQVYVDNYLQFLFFYAFLAVVCF